MHEISRDGERAFWYSSVYSAASLCCSVSVVIMGFYLFPWHMDEGFHRAFVAFRTISSCLCVAQRHEFDAEGRISLWPESAPHHSATPLSFSFSFSILIFSPPPAAFCQLHNTAPSCLHIAWSKTTIWSFTACSPNVFSLSLSHLSLLSFRLCFFSFHSWPSWLLWGYREENAGRRENEMTHWKWYCWQVMT